VLLPLAGYILLVLSALLALSHLQAALFGFGAASLLLLFVGIHNAWDNVAYHVFISRWNPDNSPEPKEAPKETSENEHRDRSNQK